MVNLDQQTQKEAGRSMKVTGRRRGGREIRGYGRCKVQSEKIQRKNIYFFGLIFKD